MPTIQINDIPSHLTLPTYLFFNGVENVMKFTPTGTTVTPWVCTIEINTSPAAGTYTFTFNGLQGSFIISNTDVGSVLITVMKAIQKLNGAWKVYLNDDTIYITSLDGTNPNPTYTFPSFVTCTITTNQSTNNELYGNTCYVSDINNGVMLEKVGGSGDTRFNISDLFSDTPKSYSLNAGYYGNTLVPVADYTLNGTYGFEFKDNELYLYNEGLNLNPSRKRFIYDNKIDFSYFFTVNSGNIPIVIYATMFNGNTTQLVSSSLTKTDIVSDFSIPFTINDIDKNNVKNITLSGSNFSVTYDYLRLINLSYSNYRITYRNSYGGLDFIDFIGGLSVQNETENITYTTNRMDRWDDTTLRSNYQTWDVNNEYTFSLTSHIVTKDYLHIFEEMIQSKYIWLEVDGIKYRVVVDSLDKEELQFGVYKITCSFRYKNQ
jgi:hypothetical protein